MTVISFRCHYSCARTPLLLFCICSILGDESFSDIICWAPSGDSFVIKDVNDFTVNLLPRTFKHSNFASFVRQLNKYDFHKVRSTQVGAPFYYASPWCTVSRCVVCARHYTVLLHARAYSFMPFDRKLMAHHSRPLVPT